FGLKFRSRSTRGRDIDLSEMTLSVRDADWHFSHCGKSVSNASTITESRFSDITSLLNQVCIRSISSSLKTKTLKIKFDKDVELAIDLSNRNKTDGDIVELALPDGRLISVGQDGVLIPNSGTDQSRAKHWSASPRRN